MSSLTEMRIKIYIVSYKNVDLLQRCIRSLLDDIDTDTSITVMNNYVPNHVPKIDLPAEILSQVTVIHNSARPAFSTGHLARSWNECIMDAIVDIDNPQCDILILAQEDTLFAPHAVKAIKKHAEKYDYLTFGAGDEVQVMTPTSIKRIGLYDERFCNIGYQEADYFRRAMLLHRDRISLNDFHHDRVINPLDQNVLLSVPNGNTRRDPEYFRSCHHHCITERFYFQKWGDILWSGWSRTAPSTASNPPKQYILYPYFERALPDQQQKYF